MKPQETKITRALHLDYTNDNTIWLQKQDTLRKLVGISGMLLPVLLFVFLYVDSGFLNSLASLSHYYFTRVSSIFVIIVSLMAIFLIVYKGKDPIDFYLSFIAGIFALCVVLFPTDNLSAICNDENFPYAVSILRDNPARVSFHYLSAAIFLGCLAAMSLFLFTRSDKAPSRMGRMKKIRNSIYIFCGILMVLAMLVILAGRFKLIDEDYYNQKHLTFWMEVIAIEAFGFSWLTKGGLFFRDR